MSQVRGRQDQLVSVFYPYGRQDALELRYDPHPHLHLGAAQVFDAKRGLGCENYVLECAAGYWVLKSRWQDESEQLLAKVRLTSERASPVAMGLALLLDLWALRIPQRLRLIANVDPGDLGREGWRTLLERRPLQSRAKQSELTSFEGDSLAHTLQAEGHIVETIAGPMRTVEHVLILGRRICGKNGCVTKHRDP